MILTPTLTFKDAAGSTAWLPVPPLRDLEAVNAAIDTAIKRARAEGGTKMALRVTTPDGHINIYSVD